MANFRSLTRDRQPLEGFKSRFPKRHAERHITSTARLNLHLFEWIRGDKEGFESNPETVEELRTQIQSNVRVLFAPPDVPQPVTIDGLYELFDQCKLPSAFVAETLRDVSQSFAAFQDPDRTTWVWFHLLCKDIAVSNGRIFHPRDSGVANDGQQGANPHQTAEGRHAQSQSQANFTWLKPGFVLKIKDQQGPPIPNRSTTSESDHTLTPASVEPDVEMFCFGAPTTLHDRFKTFKDTAACDDIMQDPYVLLEIALEEMHKVMDRTAWVLSDVFGSVELQTLELANEPGEAMKQLPTDHFTGLHNLAKHCIYLQENCESALATLEALRDHHHALTGANHSFFHEATKQALKYQRTLFQSTQRRLSSLDARIGNIIQLSFHIVTQGDSHLIKSENQSMKTIAVMMLLFTPLSTVASIFGSQFMDLKDEAPHHIMVSQDFWLLWIIAIPLTVVVFIIWRKGCVALVGRFGRTRRVEEQPRDAERQIKLRTLRRTLHWGRGC